jgi:orsellinic acid C2-O-methyltransferase
METIAMDTLLDDAPARPTPPPAAVLQQMLGGPTAASLLYVAAELGLADLVGQGHRTPAELAARTGADADALRRVLRGLAVLGVFGQPDGEHLELTALGDCLRADAPGSLRATARLMGHPVVQRAWAALPEALMSGEVAFERALGTDFGAYFGDRPELAALFNAFMGGITVRVAPAVVAAYDFAPFGTVVDVGGGAGVLLRAILRAHPAARGTIVDLPHARAQAEQAIAADGLGDRCRFLAGDFFVGLPAGADAYLLKSVIHDWDDQQSIAILRVCRRAMGPASRLLLVERLLSEGGPAEPDVVMSDLTMLTMTTGRERTEGEYRRLLEQAGLRLRRVVDTGSTPSVLEASPVEIA